MGDLKDCSLEFVYYRSPEIKKGGFQQRGNYIINTLICPLAIVDGVWGGEERGSGSAASGAGLITLQYKTVT